MKSDTAAMLFCFFFFIAGGVTCGTAAYWYGTAKGYERIIGDMQQRTMVK